MVVIVAIALFVLISIIIGVSGSYTKNRNNIDNDTYSFANELKGELGEALVASELGENIPNQKYVINDIILGNLEKSSQIDHLVITRCGIFVIETKYLSGRVFGRESQTNWIQIVGNNNKREFNNPIRQNKSHIYFLKQTLGKLAKEGCFISIIVFPLADMKTDATHLVGDIKFMHNVINTPRPHIFSIDKLNKIYQKLLHIKQNPLISKAEHINNIVQIKTRIDNNMCPRCGKDLVLRQGKYGEFWGCSSFPYCKYKKIKHSENIAS